MKKLSLFINVLGLVFLAGCSNENSLSINEGNSSSDLVARSYLSINIVSAHNAITRVNDYVDGEETENYVKAVRFFFFDDNGKASPISKRNGSGDYQSYIDWYPTTSDSKNPSKEDQEKTVEKVLSATLSVSVPSEGDTKKYPTQVLAVLNPTSPILALDNDVMSSEESEIGEDENPISTIGPDLEVLTNYFADFKDGLTESNFVISNSVYLNDEQVIKTTRLKPTDFVEAIDNNTETDGSEDNGTVVTIYVERVLARLDLSITMSPSSIEKDIIVYPTKPQDQDTNGSYDLNTEDGNTTSAQIYVKFLGWNITCTPTISNLVKNYSGTWKGETFGAINGPWSSSDYHRSFWAINPLLTYPTDYKFYSFTDIIDKEKGGLDIPAFGESTIAYLQENAALNANEKSTKYPTKVIIAAQLVDEKGEPMKIAKWANRMYTLEGVKTAIANVLDLYYYEDSGNSNKTKVQPEDVNFDTWTKIYEEADKGDEKSYYVYVKLSDDKQWYRQGATDPLTPDEVKKYVRDVVNHVMVWKEGHTYYYFDIEHLGTDKAKPGYYGVVRNHIYDSKITALTGLGTPVYDPNEEIIPEIPEDDTILSADVKILQWRVVSHDHELKW